MSIPRLNTCTHRRATVQDGSTCADRTACNIVRGCRLHTLRRGVRQRHVMAQPIAGSLNAFSLRLTYQWKRRWGRGSSPEVEPRSTEKITTCGIVVVVHSVDPRKIYDGRNNLRRGLFRTWSEEARLRVGPQLSTLFALHSRFFVEAIRSCQVLD